MGDAPPYKIVQGRRRFEDGLNSGYYGAQIAYGKIEFARTAPNMTSRRKQQVPLPLRAPYYLRRYTHTVGRQRESTPNGPTSPVKSVADITIGKGMNVSRTHATIDLNKEGTGFQIMVN